jgi:3-phenylpropionate/trans-cinnamate dioxygenase ferredoxin reductase subunit
MPHSTYLIIGGGMTADSAISGIRQIDPKGSINLVSLEPYLPYNRPPLSKGLWKGDPIESIWRKTVYQDTHSYLGHEILKLDLQNRSATDEQGTTYSFDKLLLATGGRPRKFSFKSDRIIYFRTLSDYELLRKIAKQGDRFAVIGGGFIGSEIAAALAMNKKEVVMVFPGKTMGDRIYPTDLGEFLNTYYQKKGIRMLSEASAVGLDENSDGKLILKIERVDNPDIEEIEVNGVVAGIGIQPNIELAQSAGLKIEKGIWVDEFLRTSHPDVYSAGDVAAFYNPALDLRIRKEHEDNANKMGEVAGRNMAGHSEPYHYLPFFYSDLFELGYEAVGELDSKFEIVADWKETYQKGILYYLQSGRVRGILLWNSWGLVDRARKLIAEPGPFKPDQLIGRLSET